MPSNRKKRKTNGLNNKVPAGGVSAIASALVAKYLHVDPDLAIIIGGFVGALVAYLTPGSELVNG